jgi:hypothetical protein
MIEKQTMTEPDPGPVFSAGQSVRYTGAFEAWGYVFNPVPDRYEGVSVRWVVPRAESTRRRERVCRYSLVPAPVDFIEWLATIPKALQTSRDFKRTLDGVSDALEKEVIWTGTGCIAETLRAFKASPYRDTSKAIERWLASEPDREPDWPRWLVPREWYPAQQGMDRQ